MRPVAPVKKRFVETEHPRDASGRFGRGSGKPTTHKPTLRPTLIAVDATTPPKQPRRPRIPKPKASPVPWVIPQRLVDEMGEHGVAVTPSNRTFQHHGELDGPVQPGQVVQYASMAKMKEDIAAGLLPEGSFVMYDLEGWGFSPDEEKAHPFLSMRQFVRAAHEAGLKAILVPSGTLDDKVKASRYHADVFVAQLQSTLDPVEYRDAVKRLAREKSPETALVAELSVGRTTTVNQLVRQWQAARPYVGGFSLWYGAPVTGGTGDVEAAGDFVAQADRATRFLQRVAAIEAAEAAKGLAPRAKYSPDQPRDDHGRFGEGSGSDTGSAESAKPVATFVSRDAEVEGLRAAERLILHDINAIADNTNDPGMRDRRNDMGALNELAGQAFNNNHTEGAAVFGSFMETGSVHEAFGPPPQFDDPREDPDVFFNEDMFVEEQIAEEVAQIQYEATQAGLKAANVPEEVTLYRGIRGDALTPHEGLNWCSTDLAFTQAFAGAEGRVFAVTVPREAVMYTSFTAPVVASAYAGIRATPDYYGAPRPDEWAVRASSIKGGVDMGPGRNASWLGYGNLEQKAKPTADVDLQELARKFTDGFVLRPRAKSTGSHHKYDPDQPRDDHGRFGETSGGSDAAKPEPGRNPASPELRAVAAGYMATTGREYNPDHAYVKVDVPRAQAIAELYDKAKDEPHNPEVAAAYRAFKDETLAQYNYLRGEGYAIKMSSGEGEPYRNSAEFSADVRENHSLTVLPTTGPNGEITGVSPDNPMLEQTGITVEYTDGRPYGLTYNDAFRWVHDQMGHVMEGNQTGPRGEENAWREHMQMYSPEAARAMTTETRGQNSWMNYGPGNPGGDTPLSERSFPDQKVTVLPEWVSRLDGQPPGSKLRAMARRIEEAMGAGKRAAPARVKYSENQPRDDAGRWIDSGGGGGGEATPVGDTAVGVLERPTSSDVASAALRATIDTGGATINIVTGVEPGEGMAVATQGHELVLPKDEVTQATIEQYMSDHADTLNAPNHYLGTWIDDDGLMHIDVSEIFPPGHEAEALAAGLARGELAGYDLRSGEVVDFPTGSDPAHPVDTTSVDVAANALADGKYVNLEQERGVSTLLDKLAALGQEARALGTKAPVYDLGKVTIQGTNLFMNESLGVSRAEMPQFTGTPTPGSPADAYPRDSHGEVDLSQAFIDHLAGMGVNVTNETVPADVLRATQRELDGVKVAGMTDAIEAGTYVPTERSIWTTRDDYIVDGHHTWAAATAASYELGEQLFVRANMIDMPITDALREAKDWTLKMGIGTRAVGKRRIIGRRYVKYSEDQPRDDHGRFASDGGGGDTPTVDQTPIGNYGVAIGERSAVTLPDGTTGYIHSITMSADGTRYATVVKANEPGPSELPARLLGGTSYPLNDLKPADVSNGTPIYNEFGKLQQDTVLLGNLVVEPSTGLLRGVLSEDEARAAERITTAFSPPFEIGERVILPAGEIGVLSKIDGDLVVVKTDNGQNVQDVLAGMQHMGTWETPVDFEAAGVRQGQAQEVYTGRGTGDGSDRLYAVSYPAGWGDVPAIDGMRAGLGSMVLDNHALEADSGLKNAWNGTLTWEDQLKEGAIAVKDWSCSIGLTQSVVGDISRGMKGSVDGDDARMVMLHELAHGLSDAGTEAYRSNVGMEEGVADGYAKSYVAVETYGPDAPAFHEDGGQRVPGADSSGYIMWVRGLDEGLRLVHTGDPLITTGERHDYYRSLLTTPVIDRQGALNALTVPASGYGLTLTGQGIGTKMGYQENLVDPLAHERAYNAGKSAPRAPRSKEAVIARIFASETLEQARETLKVVTAWIAAHPEDAKAVGAPAEALWMFITAHEKHRPGRASARKVRPIGGRRVKYSEDQPRDERGRFGETSGSGVGEVHEVERIAPGPGSVVVAERSEHAAAVARLASEHDERVHQQAAQLNAGRPLPPGNRLGEAVQARTGGLGHAGQGYTPDDHALIVEAITHAPENAPTLFRGFALNEDNNWTEHDIKEFTSQLVPGAEIEMRLGSWTQDKSVAQDFAGVDWKGIPVSPSDDRSITPTGTFISLADKRVVMEMDPGSHSLNMEPNAEEAYRDQAEWASVGRFQVVQVEREAVNAGYEPRVWTVRVKQVEAKEVA